MTQKTTQYGTIELREQGQQKIQRKIKDRQTGTVRGCSGTNHPEVTRKLENPLRKSGIQFPRNWIILLRESGM